MKIEYVVEKNILKAQYRKTPPVYTEEEYQMALEQARYAMLGLSINMYTLCDLCNKRGCRSYCRGDYFIWKYEDLTRGE